MAQDRLAGRTEMEALHAHTTQTGLWLLLERPGADPDNPTFRLSVRWPKSKVKSGVPWVRRYAIVRPMSGRAVADAASELLADLKRDPPKTERTP